MEENLAKKTKLMKGLKAHLAKQYLMEKEDNFGDSGEEDAEKLPPIRSNTLWDSKEMTKKSLENSARKTNSLPRTPPIQNSGRSNS